MESGGQAINDGAEMDVVVCDADLEDIIPGYLEGRRAECPVIHDLAMRGEFDELRGIAHGIKGSGGCYGFSVISDIGSAMESAAKTGELDQILKQLELLKGYLASVQVRYE